MLSFSKTAGYGIQVLSTLAEPGGPRRSADDLAAVLDVPHAYLLKVINQLAHHGLVDARRGPGGGLVLLRPHDEISLHEIVHSFDDSADHPGCLLGMDETAAPQFCPCQEFFHDITSLVEHRLKDMTLADVVKRRKRFRESAAPCPKCEPAESVAVPSPKPGIAVPNRETSLNEGSARSR